MSKEALLERTAELARKRGTPPEPPSEEPAAPIPGRQPTGYIDITTFHAPDGTVVLIVTDPDGGRIEAGHSLRLEDGEYRLRLPWSGAAVPKEGTAVTAEDLVLPRSGTNVAQVLGALTSAWMRDPGAGLTNDQVVEMTGLPLTTVSARVSELVTRGWLMDSGETRPTSGKGEQAKVRILTPAAVQRQGLAR